MLAAFALASVLAASGSGAPAPAALVPDANALPPGQLGETIRLGRTLFEKTNEHPLTKPFVRNALTCGNCHPDSGAATTGLTLVGAATAYPAWSPREKAVITLEDRVLNCFMRSMNGMRPPNGSPPAVALTTYITWLSSGMPLAMNPRYPKGPRAFKNVQVFDDEVNLEHGRQIYASRCATCHGSNGDGTPPVWGPRSYNAGAGLADVDKLAAFVRSTMPLGDPTLSESEAVDVAAYINAQPRPAFRLRDHLPKGTSYNSTVKDELVRAPTWPPRE
jgi:thiosulfate dehydrogenase